MIKYYNFLKFKMADDRHVGKYRKFHNLPPNGTKLRWLHPIVISTCPPWCGCHDNGNGHAVYRPMPVNGALNIHQLRASWGQTPEPILMKFGTPQQIRTSITVTWSNINFLTRWRIAATLKNVGNAITRLPLERLGRNLGGRSQPSHLPQKLFLGIGRYC